VYLADALILNSGTLNRLRLKGTFNEDGSPKPIVLVGANGSGKTGLLSIIADALIEVAALHFQNITPRSGAGRQFFRVLGGRTQRVTSTFELSAVRFQHGTEQLFYRAKSGQVDPKDLADDMADFPQVASWPVDKNEKVAHGSAEMVDRIFTDGVYVFFPSTRFEMPYWVNLTMLERDPESDFSTQFSDMLHKPIVVQTALQNIKPWILETLVDSNLNAAEVFGRPTLEALREVAQQKSVFGIVLQPLQAVLSEILQKPVWIARLVRGHGDRRLCIASGNDVLLPTLDNLSAGQTSLLSVLATVLRYADYGPTPKTTTQIEGIVLVDEADAHLHADLQHDVLPKLMKMFPRIQFIVSSHAPLFPLGMRQLFGNDGFTLIELPSGITIDAERFSEFDTSFAYFRATQSFERSLRDKIADSQRPLILFEGETDPKYLKTAAELLDYADLASLVDFDWVGQKTTLDKGASGGGKANLDSAFRFLVNNPQFVSRRIVLVYDSDTQKNPADHGNLFVRMLPFNEENGSANGGIENLLPECVFDPKFYNQETKLTGSKRVTIKELKKVELCAHLCDEIRDPEHFSKFLEPLTELRTLVLSAPLSTLDIPSPVGTIDRSIGSDQDPHTSAEGHR
jgi:hypothetical protein